MKMDQDRPTANANVLRRPLKTRNTQWAGATARWLGRVGLRPNHISVLSMVFGAIAGGALVASGRTDSVPGRALLLIAAAAGIQLRLLCNLFDGMVAVEGGFKTKSGEVFNELPDRFSDVVILLGAGYSGSLAGMPELGWSSALLAMLTAYVRAFGGSAGVSQQFCGPMAKPHRMAVMTFACVIGAFLSGTPWSFEIIRAALVVVVVGCVITTFRRTSRIMAELEAK